MKERDYGRYNPMLAIFTDKITTLKHNFRFYPCVVLPIVYKF